MNASIIIGLFLITPVIIMIILVAIEAKRKRMIRRALEKALDHVVKHNNLMITDIEFFRDKAIGVDKSNATLIYLNFSKESVQCLCVDLASIAFCRVTKKLNRGTGEVQEIFLQLKYKCSDQLLQLNFYDRSRDYARTKTLLLDKARLWKDKINLYKSPANRGREWEYEL